MKFYAPFSMEIDSFIDLRWNKLPLTLDHQKEKVIRRFENFRHYTYRFEINNKNVLKETFYTKKPQGKEVYTVEHSLTEEEKEVFLSFMSDYFCVYEKGKYTENPSFENLSETLKFMVQFFEKEKQILFKKANMMTDNWMIKDRNDPNNYFKVLFSEQGDYYIFSTMQHHMDPYDYKYERFRKNNYIKDKQKKLIALFKEKLKKERLRLLFV